MTELTPRGGLTSRSHASFKTSLQPHHVYEFYDRSGQALYVGCTSNLARRLTHHSMSAWWEDVVETYSNRYVNRAIARTEELRLIHELQPLHNAQGTEQESVRRKLLRERRKDA